MDNGKKDFPFRDRFEAQKNESEAKKATLRPQIPDSSFYERGRFDVIPSNPIRNEFFSKPKQDSAPSQNASGKAQPSKNANAVQTGSGTQSASGEMTSDNYCDRYQKAMRAAQGSGNATGATPEEQKKIEARVLQEEIAQRTAARDLQQEIGFWENQRGQGIYDDARILNEVDELKRKLGLVPQKYW